MQEKVRRAGAGVRFLSDVNRRPDPDNGTRQRPSFVLAGWGLALLASAVMVVVV